MIRAGKVKLLDQSEYSSKFGRNYGTDSDLDSQEKEEDQKKI